MFVVEKIFIHKSLELVSSQKSDEDLAEACIKLLKSNAINKLSAHEFSHWLSTLQDFLEKAVKVDKKGQTVLKLLAAELDFRVHHQQIPVRMSYGRISKGALVEAPTFKLLSAERISLGVIRARGVEKWDENRDVEKIVRCKRKQARGESKAFFDPLGAVNPYHAVKKLFNCPATKEFNLLETKEDADALTQYLATLGPIKWKECRMNCEYRAQAAWEYAEALNIDPASFYFATIGERNFDSSCKLRWNGLEWSYHVVLAVQTCSQEMLIIDPSVCPDRALQPADWQTRIQGSHLSIQYEPVLKENADLAARASRAPTAFAVANGEKFPNLGRIISDANTCLKALEKQFNP